MHPIAKMIIGIILVAGSVYYIWTEPLNISPYFLNAKRDLITVLDGIIPILVFVIGIFIVWLEWDELKIERELKAEEIPKPTRKTKRRR